MAVCLSVYLSALTQNIHLVFYPKSPSSSVMARGEEMLISISSILLEQCNYLLYKYIC